MALSGRQKRFLRSLGHHLKPVVMVGKEELNTAVVSATDEALEAHELIKIKVQDGCLSDRGDIAEQLAQATGAAVVQILGKNILLYRQADEAELMLPDN